MREDNDIKLGLALCTGCGIGSCLDGEALSSHEYETRNTLKAMEHPNLCAEEGIGALKAHVSENGITGLVIAACSPRVREEDFRLEGVVTERVNLREQLCWLMDEEGEDLQDAAMDQVRMALAKLEATTPVSPYIPEEISEDILVVGGGMAGISAALEGVKAGRNVHLVERTGELGGYAGKIWKGMPEGEDPLRDPEIPGMSEEFLTHDRLNLHLNTQILSIKGEPGNFHVRLDGPDTKEISAGAVIAATGWRPYDASRLSHLGYGSDHVRTLEEFEALAKNGKFPRRVLFVLCAGSRDEDHLPYCSSYCCSAALKQALYIREAHPESEVYIVYRDIRTPAFQEDFYKRVQADESILMTRGKVHRVEEREGKMRVSVAESLLGGEIMLECDLVVLATGMVPGSTKDLKLQYRLGEGLPELEYDFSDSHFICFPYETRRTGVYAAGTVRAPMDMVQSQEDGAGAMLKAIQCIECVKRGESVHPRSGDQTYPDLYMERCTDCKRCTEECPFGSYDETEKGTPLPNPSRCRRCGICMGSCPERVIGFADYSINSVSAMIKSVSMPDEFEEKPRVLVFLCENDAYPALDAAGLERLRISPFVRILPVRCLGSINKVWISDALSHGYDGILQIGCKPGDDYQCHFIQGSELTEQRAENLQETLQTMMLEPERIRTRFVEINAHHDIVEIINEYMEELEMIGPIR